MAFQEFINDIHMAKTNLSLINNGSLKQTPAQMAQRYYYFLYFEATEDPCIWRNVLFPNKPVDHNFTDNCDAPTLEQWSRQ